MTPPLPDRIAAAIDELSKAACEAAKPHVSLSRAREARAALEAAIAEVVAERDDLRDIRERHISDMAAVAQRHLDAAAERDALRSERDAALLVLPACCGSLADAADTLRQDRDAERTRADDLEAELAKSKADGAMLCRQIDRQQLRIASLHEEQKLVDVLTNAIQAVRSQAREKWRDLLALHDRQKAKASSMAAGEARSDDWELLCAERDAARAVVKRVIELIDGSDGGVKASAADVWNYCTKMVHGWAVAERARREGVS
ncbi:MAG: hypothetical protein ACK5UQ_22765 [Planctomycetota bacterium]